MSTRSSDSAHAAAAGSGGAPPSHYQSAARRRLMRTRLEAPYRPGDPIVRTVNLTRRFLLGNSAVYAVRQVSLDVKPGEFVLITGPSGCGKTTLLNLMGGLDRPTHGDVVVEGRTLSKLGEDGLACLRRDRIGFVFQFFHLLADLTAEENIMLPMRLVGTPDAVARARAVELLASVGMGARARHSPSEMSGGEQQRVAIARALANSPTVVLADEPTGNLDRRTGAEVIDLFRRFNRERRQTFVVVSHDQSIAGLADRVVHMEDGRIARIEERPA
jgi:ABC-type lipoprotein export system ATPase subunit